MEIKRALSYTDGLRVFIFLSAKYPFSHNNILSLRTRVSLSYAGLTSLLSRGLHQPLPCTKLPPPWLERCSRPPVSPPSPLRRPPQPPSPPPQEQQRGENACRGGGSPAVGAAAPPGRVSFGADAGARRRRRGRSPRQRERGAGAGGAAEAAGGTAPLRPPPGAPPRQLPRGRAEPLAGRGKGGGKPTGLTPTGGESQQRGRARGCAEDPPGHPRRCPLMLRLLTPCQQGNPRGAAVRDEHRLKYLGKRRHDLNFTSPWKEKNHFLPRSKVTNR